MRIIIITLSCWLTTAGITALLCGSFLFVSGTGFHTFQGNFILVFIGSLVLSAPAIFVTGLTILAKLLQDEDGDSIFSSVLHNVFTTSLGMGILMYFFMQRFFHQNAIWLQLLGLMAIITAVMLHHNKIKQLAVMKPPG